MSLQQKIINDCEKDTTKEICGFVVNTESGLDIIPTENKSPNPENEFYIPAKEFLYMKKKNNLVGIYHSHLESDAKPSEFDKKSADLTCFPFVIYSIKTNRFNIHVPEYLDMERDLLENLKKELL